MHRFKILPFEPIPLLKQQDPITEIIHQTHKSILEQ